MPGTGPTALRKGFQAVACFYQFSRKVLGSALIKSCDVIVDMTDIA
jgi:hypothetical protein